MFGSAASALPSPDISSSAASAAIRPAPWFAPIAATSMSASRFARLRRAYSRERLGAVVERHQRDDRERGDAAHRLDRVAQLVQVVERLDHEEVGAAALEDLRLVGEQLAAHARGRGLAERADRAGDENVAAGHLARVAGELDRGGVDPLEVVLEEVLRELAPVRAERVRLDQLGAGVDEGDVERDDRVGRAQVRLLRAAQAWHRGGDERAHASVGDDGGPILHPLQKSACQRTPFLPRSAC